MKSSERLHYFKKGARTFQKAENALITELPGETVRWIKRRRRQDCKDLVPITHYRNKQLREMFHGLDFQNHGKITLKAFKDVLTYVQEHSKSKLLRKNLKLNQHIFDDMENIFESIQIENGSEIDFKVFTTFMTGTSKSILDIATEYDIEKLYLR